MGGGWGWGGRWVGVGGGRWVGGGGGGRWVGGGVTPLPTHPPLRFTREQTRVEYIRRCRLKMKSLEHTFGVNDTKIPGQFGCSRAAHLHTLH